MAVLIEELVTGVKDSARSIVESLGEEHVLMLFIISGDVVYPVLGLNQIPRSLRGLVLQGVLGQFSAQAYVLVGEAWYTTSKRPLIEDIPVASLPLDDRQENLFIIAIEKGKVPTAYSATIDLKPEGRRLRGWERLGESEGKLSGGMVVTDW